jgi:sirohydrochlorin ferrochelatase
VSERVLLMDNGSLEPESTLQLRRLAAELEIRLERRVDAVSLAHSAKIPPAVLNRRPAELFEAALDRGWREGVKDFLVLPLFVGPSYALTRHVPALLAERRKRSSSFRARLVSPLFTAGETRLAQILADHVREQIVAGERPRVAIVDHGSPNSGVTDVRDLVTNQVRDLLGETVLEVEGCSMERRDGAEYDFNDPLLASLLARPGWKDDPVVLGMLFIAPGRHAGREGDVAQICRGARNGGEAGLKLTRLLGEHPLLLDILVDRALGK